MFSVATTTTSVTTAVTTTGSRAGHSGDTKEEMYLSSNNLEDEVNEFSIDALSQFVLSCLHSGRTSNHSLERTSFLVPDGLAQYIAREIKALSHVEPYGIRGCTLCIGFQDSKAQTCVRLGKFPLDPSFVSTFEIALCFKEDAGRNIWSLRTLRTLLPPLDGLLLRSQDSNVPSTFSSSLVISKEVDIVKKKLYRSSR